MGVCNKIAMFPFSIILGFAQGFQPVAGFNWGAKRFDRVRESYRFSSIVALVGGVVMAVILILTADPLIVMFAGTDGEMRHIGVICMISQCIALPVHGWVAIVNMLCAGLGNAKGAVTLATARQGTCFIPILYPMAWILRAYGIATVQAVADVLTILLAIPIIRSVKKKIAQAEQELQAE